MTNTLSPYEVSIIKNLINRREHTSQEIAGLINRHRGDPKSDISSGRISNIKKDQIQKYSGVEPSDDLTVDKFLEKLSILASSETGAQQSQTSKTALANLLPIRSTSPFRLNITETDQIECKESFSYPLKTIAAFANNKGGYLVFGVKNKTWDVLGLDPAKLKKFHEHDLKDINQKVRSALGIDLPLQKISYQVGDKHVGILYVSPAHTKPLIFSKSVNDGGISIAEGHIYYRYSGEDRLIAPIDLQHIIEERIRQLSETILTNQISKILQIGPTNAAILDTKTGIVDGPSGNFVIDEELLTELSFIKEGEFTEKKGAPTLKLIGELQPVGHAAVQKSYQNITNEDLIICFLEQKAVPNPKLFIRHLKSTPTHWLPIYYYMHLAGLKKHEAIKVIEEKAGGLKGSRDFQIDRLRNNKLPQTGGGGTVECVQRLKASHTFDVDKLNKAEKVEILRSIHRVDQYDVKRDYLFDLLKKIFILNYESDDDSQKSLIRAAVAFADSIYFKKY